MDVSDLASVRRAADSFLATGRTLDVLINNAGVAGTEALSADGFDLTYATNHIGPFHLTNLLLPALRRAPQGRMVNVSSVAPPLGQGHRLVAARAPHRSQAGPVRRLRRHQAHERAARQGARPPAGRYAGDDVRAPSRRRGVQHLALGAAAAPLAHPAVSGVERRGREDPALVRHRARAGVGDRPLLRQVPGGAVQSARQRPGARAASCGPGPRRRSAAPSRPPGADHGRTRPGPASPARSRIAEARAPPRSPRGRARHTPSPARSRPRRAPWPPAASN